MKWLKKKGIYSLFVVSLFALLLLAACSNENSRSTTDSEGDNEDTGSETETSEEEVTITLTGWQSNPNETERLEEVVATFEEQNPNINVEIEAIAEQYMDVLKSRLIGGQAGDVFYLDALEAPGLIEQGVLEPLNDYVTEDFNVDDFEAPLLDAFTKDGTYYGFPKDVSTLALFYNKTMFEVAGIKEVPTTMEEVREVSEQLTQGDEIYGFGVAPELARMYHIGESRGGEIITDNQATFGEENTVNALQPIVDQVVEDQTAAEPSRVGAPNTGDMFGQGKAAMVLEGPWNIPYYKEAFPELDYGVAEHPTVNGKETTMAFTVAYVMNNQSEHKEEAWKLLSFLTSQEGMKQWTEDGIALPTRASVAEETGYADDELRAPFVAGSSYATVWQDGVHLPIVTTNFNNQFVSAILGNQTLEEALQQAQETANEEIANAN